jgi:threonine synthase
VFTADGTSDDIDQPIRKLFADTEFVKKYNLCSANSLNWARIMVQIVHFFYAYLKVRLCTQKKRFLSVRKKCVRTLHNSNLLQSLSSTFS